MSRNQAEDIAADYSYDDSELRSRIEALEQELGDVRDLALENAQNAESARETYNRNAEILNSHIAEYRSHIH